MDQKEATKYFPEPNFHQKQVYDYWLVVCSYPNLLELSYSQSNFHISEVSQKNWGDILKTSRPIATKWSVKWSQFFSTMYVIQPILHKLNKWWLEVLLHLSHSLDLLPSNKLFFKHLENFSEAKCFTTRALQMIIF